MGDDGQDDSLFPQSDFPYLIIIVVVLAHISIMAIVIYYSCCRNRRCCVWRINIQNNTIHQNSFSETSRISATVAQGDSTDSDSLVENNERPITNWNTSLITRIRTQMQGDTGTSGTSGTPVSGLPPPYSERGTSPVQFNAGAQFEDIDLHLPAYDDIVVALPPFEETGRHGAEKPPTYEEATEAKSREK